MEHTGYILFIPSYKKYYSFFANVDDPFMANFYFSQEEAINKKNELEDVYRNNVDVLKVKKTIKIVN